MRAWSQLKDIVMTDVRTGTGVFSSVSLGLALFATTFVQKAFRQVKRMKGNKVCRMLLLRSFFVSLVLIIRMFKKQAVFDFLVRKKREELDWYKERFVEVSSMSMCVCIVCSYIPS